MGGSMPLHVVGFVLCAAISYMETAAKSHVH